MKHNVPTHSNDGGDEDSADNDKKELNRVLKTRNMQDDVKKELYFNEKQKIWAKQKPSEPSSRKEIFLPVDDLKGELLKSVTVSCHYKVFTLFQFLKENPSFLKMSKQLFVGNGLFPVVSIICITKERFYELH